MEPQIFFIRGFPILGFTGDGALASKTQMRSPKGCDVNTLSLLQPTWPVERRNLHCLRL